MIKQHSEASFEVKTKLIKDYSDKKYKFLNKIVSSVVKVTGLAALTVLGSKAIEEFSACKQTEIKEDGKKARTPWAKKK